MNRPADFRFPGVAFLPRQPAGRLPLPPLDAAAFVGFAERGPLNLPVMVEDFNTFQQVFGGDLPVAQEVGGRVVFANLPGVVKSFFVNGGRRCYVVRVAGEKANAARTRIPGMVALGAGSGPRLGAVSASSPGKWGAGLRLAARLSAIPLSSAGLGWKRVSGGLPALRARSSGLRLPGLAPLQPGDVLRLSLGDGSTWLGLIEALEADGRTAGALPGGSAVGLAAPADVSLRFRRFYRILGDLASSPPYPVQTAELLTIETPTPLASTGPLGFIPSDQAGQAFLALDPADVSRLNPGDVLHLTLAEMPPGDLGCLTRIREIRVIDSGSGSSGSVVTSGSAGSPPATVSAAFLSPLLLLGPAEAAPSFPEDLQNPSGILAIQLLRFDMLLQAGTGGTGSALRLPVITNLAFAAPHPHFWGDAILLESSLLTALRLKNRGPNDLSTSSRPSAVKGSANPFSDSAGWFRCLTQDLYDLGPLSEDSRMVLEDPPQSFSPLTALSGLLAPAGSLLDLTWESAQDMPDDRQVSENQFLTFLPLDMPEVFSEGDPAQFRTPESGRMGKDDLDTFNPAVFYDPRLAPANSGCQGSGLGASQRTLMETAFDLHDVQRIRLRGMHSLLFIDEVGQISVPDASHLAWSLVGPLPEPDPPAPVRPAPEPDCPPDSDFADCTRPPILSEVNPYFGPMDQSTQVTIEGRGFTSTSLTRVFFGRRPASDVQVVSSTLLTASSPPGFNPGPVEVRIENENGAGLLVDGYIYIVRSTGPDLPTIPSEASRDPGLVGPLLCVQQALLILCQGRGDVMAVYSLPRHYGLEETLDWQQVLRQRLGLPALGQGFAFDEPQEVADLSYAAAYHPWLLVSDPGSPDGTRPEPPDGAVCGMIAANELASQVWVAPANLPLQTLMGLDQIFDDDRWAEFFANRINLVRPEASTFRVMSAHTLSGERSLMQISVRRLLIQLRKAAIILGMDYVFENNNELFREGVRVVLEELLRFMFERGAFTGRTEAQSFRVITDDSVNPPESIDQGRFIALIQVAPSQPMEFISVQLTRSGDGGLITANEGG